VLGLSKNAISIHIYRKKFCKNAGFNSYYLCKMKTVKLEITGKVQGVFFRAKAKEVAEINRISGWIRNTDNGKVEASITGEDDAVEKFITWCKHGPEKAKVDNVSAQYVELKNFDEFTIIR
jgi:acylphosphatase